ncbi:MAG TPA: HAD-IIIA family hydrolase, partial [Bacillota bacterium]|nr:HAD-IIIA family hydrolase [Bacillota bacterium]
RNPRRALNPRFDEIKASTHRPRAGCSCRKPKPGMILDLAAKYDIDLAKSYMVGDRDSDIEAGRAAGIKTIFIGNRAEAPEEADFTAPDLFSAAEMILRE